MMRDQQGAHNGKYVQVEYGRAGVSDVLFVTPLGNKNLRISPGPIVATYKAQSFTVPNRAENHTDKVTLM